MRFKLLNEDEDKERIVVVKDDKGSNPLTQIMETYMADMLRKALDKHGEKKDDKPKGRTFTKSEATCWTIILCAAAPWIGAFMLKSYAIAMLSYGIVIPVIAR